MKYLIVLFTILLAGVAHGQIQEKDLLGEWKTLAVETSGVSVNLKTGEVTFTDEMEKMIEESGEDIDAVKPMIVEEMRASQFGLMKMVFKPGLKAEWIFGEDLKEFGYTILEENGVAYISRPDGGGKMQASFKDGILSLIIADDVKVSFEKKK